MFESLESLADLSPFFNKGKEYFTISQQVGYNLKYINFFCIETMNEKLKWMTREFPKRYHHHHPVPCFIALAIMSFHIPRSLVAFRISTTLPAPSHLTSPSVIFSRCFPLLRFPSIIPVVMRCSNLPKGILTHNYFNKSGFNQVLKKKSLFSLFLQKYFHQGNNSVVSMWSSFCTE